VHPLPRATLYQGVGPATLFNLTRGKKPKKPAPKRNFKGKGLQKRGFIPPQKRGNPPWPPKPGLKRTEPAGSPKVNYHRMVKKNPNLLWFKRRY